MVALAADSKLSSELIEECKKLSLKHYETRFRIALRLLEDYPVFHLYGIDSTSSSFDQIKAGAYKVRLGSHTKKYDEISFDSWWNNVCSVYSLALSPENKEFAELVSTESNALTRVATAVLCAKTLKSWEQRDQVVGPQITSETVDTTGMPSLLMYLKVRGLNPTVHHSKSLKDLRKLVKQAVALEETNEDYFEKLDPQERFLDSYTPVAVLDMSSNKVDWKGLQHVVDYTCNTLTGIQVLQSATCPIHFELLLLEVDVEGDQLALVCFDNHGLIPFSFPFLILVTHASFCVEQQKRE